MSKKSNESKKIKNERASSLKLFSVTSVLIVLAIILVLNILLSQTLDGLLTFDLSSNAQNSVSEQTLDYIESLPADTKIRIVGLFDEPTSVENTPYEYIVPMLNDLAGKSSGKVTVEYINPDKYPTIIKEIDPNGLSNATKDLYAVCCNGMIRVVDPYNDCFVYDNSLYEQYNQLIPTANKAESSFINTIISLTSESKYKVYYLTGVQEDSHTYLDSVFASMNIEVAELPVADPFVVPDDCSLLIINNPNIDITESVQEGIKQYIKNGNHPVNIICSVGITEQNINEDFTHLNNVLTEVNLAVESKYITELDPSYIIGASNGTFKGSLVGDYAELSSQGIGNYQLSRSIVATSRASSSIGSSPILVTSNNAELYYLNETNEDGSEKVETRANSIVAATGYYVGTDNPVNVYVFGSAAFTTDKYLAQLSSNDVNIQIIRNVIGKIFTTENSVEVPSKLLSDYTVDVNKITASTLSVVSVIFIAVIPIAFVMVAAIVYHKRSHL